MEMNCVLAGIVKKPEEYDFSSYKARIGLKNIKWLDYDPLYLDLGNMEKRDKRSIRIGSIRPSQGIN